LNVDDLSFLYIGDDLRMNSFEKRGNDVIQETPKDPLEVPVGPVTRFRAKRFKKAFKGLFRDT